MNQDRDPSKQDPVTPETPDVCLRTDEHRMEKKKKKRRMLIALCTITILAAISYVLLEHPEFFERKSKENGVTSMYSDRLTSYVFYPSNYDLDPTQDEWYMQLDRLLHYKNGNVSIAVTHEDAADYNRAVAFFLDYFDTVIAGDADTYNTYFTERYYESNKPYLQFAPQMLYDIEVEQLSESTKEDGTTFWKFNVKYKIYHNDGTFRNDIDSDAAKKLYFELIEGRDGTVRVDYITYYKMR